MLETSRSLLQKKLNIMLKDTRAASARAAYTAREHDCACLLKVCSQALDQDHSKGKSNTTTVTLQLSIFLPKVGFDCVDIKSVIMLETFSLRFCCS